MMNKKNNAIFILVFSALCVALSITIRSLSFFVPIGIPILKIGFNGPPLRLISVLFGPLYGGAVSGVTDILGFFLTDKSGKPLFYELTVTAVLNGLSVGLLWNYFKRISATKLKVSYFLAMAALMFYGLISFFMTYGKENSLKEVQGSLVIIIGALFGFLIYALNTWIVIRNERKQFGDYFFQMFLSITIPGIFFNWVNTYILVTKFSLNKNFFLYGMARSGVQLLESYYNSIAVLFVILLLLPLLQKRNINPFGYKNDRIKE